MNQFLQLIDTGDPCSLLFLVMFLLVISMHFVRSKEIIRLWSVRLGFLSLVAYLVREVWMFGVEDPDRLIAATFRASLSAGLVTAAFGLVLPVAIALCWDFTVSAFLRHLRAQYRVFKSQRRQIQVRGSDSDSTLQRQRREQQNEERRMSQIDGNRRRATARADVFRHFAALKSSIGDRFTQDQLEKYVADFMGDEHPSEDVENRGSQLIEMLTELTSEPASGSEKISLEQLASWFVDQKKRIDALPLDEIIKQRLNAGLNVRYAELTEQLIQDLRP